MVDTGMAMGWEAMVTEEGATAMGDITVGMGGDMGEADTEND